VENKLPRLNNSARRALLDRHAAFARRALAIAAVCTGPAAVANEPLRAIEITPHNERLFYFSVALSGRSESREMIVTAPQHTHHDCIVAFSATELNARDGTFAHRPFLRQESLTTARRTLVREPNKSLERARGT
jgi:hypothetical protein